MDFHIRTLDGNLYKVGFHVTEEAEHNESIALNVVARNIRDTGYAVMDGSVVIPWHAIRDICKYRPPFPHYDPGEDTD